MKTEIKEILEDIKEHSDSKNATPFELIDIECQLLLDYITNLQEENKELKMTNLALADDITKNKIIKQEVLTECCGIPIGEIPMLKTQNDEYKQRINKAIEYINNGYLSDGEMVNILAQQDLLNILKGEEK